MMGVNQEMSDGRLKRLLIWIVGHPKGMYLFQWFSFLSLLWVGFEYSPYGYMRRIWIAHLSISVAALILVSALYLPEFFPKQSNQKAQNSTDKGEEQ